MVELPDLPEHGDIANWLEAHDAVEPETLRGQVEALADAAEPVSPKRPRPQMERFRPFPVDSLPEPMQDLVAAGAKAIGCDPSYVALPLFSALASAIGATKRIELKPTWREPSVIWAATVGESGTLKSPAMSLALSPLKRFQAWRLEEYPELLEQYERDKVVYEAELANWKKKGRNGGEPPPEKPQEPAVERYLVNDTTIEALAERLQHAPRGLLAASDELGVWLGSFDQYRSGRGGDVAK